MFQPLGNMRVHRLRLRDTLVHLQTFILRSILRMLDTFCHNLYLSLSFILKCYPAVFIDVILLGESVRQILGMFAPAAL